MKIFSTITLVCMATALASCDDSEVFYTTSYPIVRIEASTTIAEPTPPPAAVRAEQTLIQTINSEVLAAAPVLAQGAYRLDFTRHNGGTLTVDTATDSGQIVGTFDKTPGKSEVNFRFAEQDYTVSIGSYTDQDGKRKVLLTIDFTKAYQAQYPDGKITGVTRLEYTSTPSK